MFKNHHPAYFFTHYLNTSVFSSPTQTQYSAPNESDSFPLCTKLTGVFHSKRWWLSAVWRIGLENLRQSQEVQTTQNRN